VAEVVRAVRSHVAELVQGPVDVLLPGEAGAVFPFEAGPAADARETAVAQWAFDHKRVAGLGTDTLPGARSHYLPLLGTRAALGVLGVRPDPALLPLDPDQLDLLDTLGRQAASALERVRLGEQAEQARLAVETERLRSTLLSSVSHDLRTPLAAITGAASTLLQPGALGEGAERELKEAIHEEAERLNRLVSNLLDMTRLEAGSLRLQRDWHSLEELVGTALARLEGSTRDRPVSISIPPDLPLVPVDPVLVEQLLVNLLENAFKYTPAGTPVRISAEAAAAHVEVEIADEGPGFPAGAEERIFEKFYRGPSTAHGSGLGLPICKAIVTAHGGRIQAENRARGAAFRFSLPLGDGPPAAVEGDADPGRA
jgi:two-component system sensor histidine kinase KdpD